MRYDWQRGIMLSPYLFTSNTMVVVAAAAAAVITRKLSYRKDDRAMRPNRTLKNFRVPE